MNYKLCKKLKDAGFPQNFIEGSWFYTLCDSLSYAYGNMKGEKDIPDFLDNLNLKPKKLPKDYKLIKPSLLTDQGVDSGYYGWGLEESFPKEKELQERYFIKIPTLSELIEACPKKRGYVGDSPFGLICREDGWEAGYLDSEGCWENDTYGAKEDQVGKGDTPEEAVANLWLKLYKND